MVAAKGACAVGGNALKPSATAPASNTGIVIRPRPIAHLLHKTRHMTVVQG
jgi:hypothetical protein